MGCLCTTWRWWLMIASISSTLRPVAQTMGEELGWSKRRVKAEAEAWIGAAAEEGIDQAATG